MAVDHGLFGEPSFLPGIEDMQSTNATLVDAGPDAIQLSVGQAPLLQRIPGPKPALVLRTDVANVYGRDGMRQPFHCATPEEAAATHRLFTAALESQARGAVVDCG